MDNLNNLEEVKETQPTKPILLIILLIVIIAVAVFLYRKKSPASLAINLNVPTVEELKPINIDFYFLTSNQELQLLEAMPDYPAFREATGTEVVPGRINPFLPPAGMRSSSIININTSSIKASLDTNTGENTK